MRGWAVELVSSPKFQYQELGDSVIRFVNLTAAGLSRRKIPEKVAPGKIFGILKGWYKKSLKDLLNQAFVRFSSTYHKKC
jgi:hypothetical protein